MRASGLRWGATVTDGMSRQMTLLPVPAQRPFYSLAEAGRYARTTRQTAARWVRGYTYPTVQGPRASPPVASARGKQGTPLTFEQLIEVAVAAAVRRAGVPMKDLRYGIDFATREFGWPRPLLMGAFRLNGRELFVSHHDDLPVNLSRLGQTAWPNIEEVLEQLDYAKDIAGRWWPLGKDTPVFIDPSVSFGRPSLHPTAISTEAILSRFDAGEGVLDLADDYQITPTEIEAAIRFENRAAAIAA